uniref:Lcl C-terminal domain-containing protein n=1 Tax=Crenothrix polyspora TaxID=360316 RepID=UPI001177536D
MKLRRSLSHPPLTLLALSMCVISATEAATNKKPIANAGRDQVVGFSFPVALNGSLSTDAGGSIKKYQWSQLSGPKIGLSNPLTAKPTFVSPIRVKNQKPLVLIFKLTVTDNLKAVASDNVVVAVVPGKLNDSGIYRCSNSGSTGLNCPVANYAGQDADSGRDATNYNGADGLAGFNFTKISGNGKTLPASASVYDCVKDIVTGLMWEKKTGDGGLHERRWTYTWYEADKTKNGGAAGKANGGVCGDKNNPPASACDTAAYVKAVNTEGWCDAKDWRMPTKEELHSIVYYADNYYNEAIDYNYFSDVYYNAADNWWTSSPYAGDINEAWYIGLDFGYGDSANKNV